jgi:hypothetical protein
MLHHVSCTADSVKHGGDSNELFFIENRYFVTLLHLLQ